MLPDRLAKPREPAAPNEGTAQSGDRVAAKTHPQDTGGDADQMADHRQQPREEHAGRAIASAPALRQFPFGLPDPDVAPKAHDQRVTQEPGGPVHYGGPDERSCR